MDNVTKIWKNKSPFSWDYLSLHVEFFLLDNFVHFALKMLEIALLDYLLSARKWRVSRYGAYFMMPAFFEGSNKTGIEFSKRASFYSWNVTQRSAYLNGMMNWWKSQLQTFQLRPRQLRRQVPRRRHWLGRNWQKFINYQLFDMCVIVDADNVDIKTQIWLVVPSAIKCQVSDDYLTMSSSILIRSVSPTTTIRSQALQKTVQTSVVGFMNYSYVT